METLSLSRAILNPDLRLKYLYVFIASLFFFKNNKPHTSSLEIIPKCKRIQYEEMLVNTSDDNLLNEFVEYEYVENNQKIADKLELIKAPRDSSLNPNKHYDLLNVKHLPTLSDGYLVQVNFHLRSF